MRPGRARAIELLVARGEWVDVGNRTYNGGEDYPSSVYAHAVDDLARLGFVKVRTIRSPWGGSRDIRQAKITDEGRRYLAERNRLRARFS